MKKTKIKWGNVIKTMVLLFCVGVITVDLYRVIFQNGMFTWFGLITDILCWLTVGAIYEDFEEQIKNIPSYKPRHAKDIK